MQTLNPPPALHTAVITILELAMISTRPTLDADQSASTPAQWRPQESTRCKRRNRPDAKLFLWCGCLGIDPIPTTPY